MKKWVILCTLIFIIGCDEPKEEEQSNNGGCTQACVNNMINRMSDSDYNNFTAESLKATQEICEKNGQDRPCMYNTSTGSFYYK